MGNLEDINEREQNFKPPERLNSSHDFQNFYSGEEILDEWLKKTALHDENADASRTYVVCLGSKVVGYYALAVGSVVREGVSKKIGRNMPNPIPVMVLGRLAVDQNWQSQGIGKALLRNAVERTLQAAKIAGIKALLVHAISQKAKVFYEKFGFKSSPLDPMTLMVTIDEVKKSF